MLNIRFPLTDLGDRYKTLYSLTSILDVELLGEEREGERDDVGILENKR